MEFRLPELGEGITDATVVNIPVKTGDTVKKGQTIIEVETDKASMPIEAPNDAVVGEIHVKAGEKVKVGAVIAKLNGSGSGAAPANAAPTKPTPPPPAPKAPPAPNPAPTQPTAATPSKVEFRLPNLGEGIENGTVVSISVKVGESIKKDQEIFTLETDKAAMPIPAPSDAKVEEIRIKLGDKVSVGSVIAVLTTASAPASATPVKTPAAVATAPVAESTVKATATTTTSPNGSSTATVHTGSGPVPAGPATRRYAREHGVNLGEVPGSARGGRVTVDDVKGHIRHRMAQPAGTATVATTAKPAAPALPDFSKFGPVEKKPITSLRKRIAENLTVAAAVPTVTQFDLADITDLEAGRKRIVENLPKGAPKITMTVLAIKAVVAALKEFPHFNSSLDLPAGEQHFKNYFHIGIAVDTERGLVVPVIKDADKKSIRDLAKDVAELADKARNGKLVPDDMRGGSFTITNLGGVGGTAFTPILNYPEVAILGMARSSLQPIIRNGQIESRLMLPLCLTYDHRVIDGADGARFTTRLVQLFSDPIRLLMES